MTDIAFLGVDGGGTGCRARVENAAGEVLGQGFAGPATTRLGIDKAWASVMTAANAALAEAGIDAEQHYLTYGWREGRNPNQLFNTAYYLARNPDVAAAGVNPLIHFAAFGWKEGRDPSAQFSVTAYERLNSDVAAAGIDPLRHYLANGVGEGRKTA